MKLGLVEGEVNGGDTVEVFTHDKKFVGRGYINPKSQILVRLLTRDRRESRSMTAFSRTGCGRPGNTGSG